MDRFEWLKCQPWLLPAKLLDSSDDADAVDWFFHGFASFYTCPLPSQQDQALSENAAHLFFSTESPSGHLDPAQLTLKLGLPRQGPQCNSRDLLFAFENADSYYLLDFKQVASVSKWRREQGYKICQKSCDAAAVEENDSSCSCQHLPTFVTVELKHLSLIIYTKDQSDSQINGVVDILGNAFSEEKELHHKVKEDPSLSASEIPGNLCSILGSSTRVLQQFLSRLDFMSEAAVAAVDVCNSDISHMARILHVLLLHAAECREWNSQSQSLQCQLQSSLKALEEEKEAHFSNVWNTAQQEAKVGSVASLQHLLDQKKHLEEAILWMELINGTTTF